jgi:hypothetical protein
MIWKYHTNKPNVFHKHSKEENQTTWVLEYNKHGWDWFKRSAPIDLHQSAQMIDQVVHTDYSTVQYYT